MFVQLQNLLPLESKTKARKIIYKNITEDLLVKKKIYNFINIGATENTGNVYHNTSQNLHFDHAP